MAGFHGKRLGLALCSVFVLASCKPREFNESGSQGVGSGGNSFVEELLNHHRNSMSPDLVNKLNDTDFYVFNRGCAAGRAPEEVARRPIDGSRDPAFNNSADPFPHQDTCQNTYIDPANYDFRAVVRRKFDSSPGSSSPGTPRMEGQSSVVDVFQVPPNSPRYRKRCYNSLPNGRAIYRIFNKAGSAFSGVPYYEVRSHDVTVGVIVDIQKVVNEGLDRSPSDQLDLESGFYPRVFLMPGLCGVGAPLSSKVGKTPGGLPGSLPVPGQCHPGSQNPTTQNPTTQNPNCSSPGSNPASQQPVLQAPQPQNQTGQQPASGPKPQDQSPPVLVPRNPGGGAAQQ